MKAKKSFVIVVLLLLVSCSAEDGEDGAIGPQGAPGIDGVDGMDGEDGNANVFLRTIDPFPEWQLGEFLGGPANFVTLEEELLDQATVDSALILVFFEIFNDGIWHPMTFNYTFSNGEEVIVTYTYTINEINIYAFRSGLELNAGITKVRYFIIPATDGTTSKNGGPEYRKMTHKELVDHFGLDY